MTTMHCPYCNAEVEVTSRRQKLRAHIAEFHPEEQAKMDDRQAFKKWECRFKFRCAKCEQLFSDTELYEAHFAKFHADV